MNKRTRINKNEMNCYNYISSGLFLKRHFIYSTALFLSYIASPLSFGDWLFYAKIKNYDTN